MRLYCCNFKAQFLEECNKRSEFLLSVYIKYFTKYEARGCPEKISSYQRNALENVHYYQLISRIQNIILFSGKELLQNLEIMNERFQILIINRNHFKLNCKETAFCSLIRHTLYHENVFTPFQISLPRKIISVYACQEGLLWLSQN